MSRAVSRACSLASLLCLALVAACAPDESPPGATAMARAPSQSEPFDADARGNGPELSQRSSGRSIPA